MAKVNKKSKDKLSKKEMTKIANDAYESLDYSFERLETACRKNGMDILVDLMTISRKIAKIYRAFHLSQIGDEDAK